MKAKRILVLSLFGVLVAQTTGAATIDMVTVGNPGNAPDTRYNNMSFGSVDHVYQIGKYEITTGQYTEFLNAVAKADPNSLYNSFMDISGIPDGPKILRSGSSPNDSYSVAADLANRPMNYVTFWDAARFANWLHNGQPAGPQGPGTTEGGAYHDVGSDALFGRNPGARFFIPTEDEWYKAAYHNKSAGLAGSYFDYPTGTDSVPGHDVTELTNPGNNANYAVENSTYYHANVGEYGDARRAWRVVQGLLNYARCELPRPRECYCPRGELRIPRGKSSS
jgi:formylglycine-generating enzyme